MKGWSERKGKDHEFLRLENFGKKLISTINIHTENILQICYYRLQTLPAN
jgi:hypothetical protein